MFLILCIIGLLPANSIHAAEGLQKLRVAYAAITAAFSIPWIAKEAGLYQRHGLDVELIYIASGPRAVQTLVAGGIDIAAFGGAAAIDARLAGDRVAFVLVDNGTSHRFEGRVQGTLSMEGTVQSGAGRNPAAGTWRATRVVRGADEG